MTATPRYAARYHIESYGPGRSVYTLGPVLSGREVLAAPGPEGWLRIARLRDGRYVIGEIDTDVCPVDLLGAEVSVEFGGRWILDDPQVDDE